LLWNRGKLKTIKIIPGLLLESYLTSSVPARIWLFHLNPVNSLTFATRPSALARWQTQWVIQALQQAWPGLVCQEEIITTRGDRILDQPLPEIGGKGIFTQELEAALLDGRVHAAVHSLKDLPVADPVGLVTGAIPARAEVRDVLVSARGYTLDSLPDGARVGTSSLRRSAQLLALRPDLRIESLRGNVDTRLRKARQEQYDAIILAGAGVMRLGLAAVVSQWLPLSIMLPAPGQGALAVQCRAEDGESLAHLSALEDTPTRLATLAERAFLAHLGGGCSLPIAAYATVIGRQIELQGLVASLDGQRVIKCVERGVDPDQLGRTCARLALEAGAAAMLPNPSGGPLPQGHVG
jgi:hydroxymethylbilane synthase